MESLNHNIVDALCRNLAGKPASTCDWRDLLSVRDVVDGLLDGEVNRRQNTAPTEPARASATPLARGAGSTTDYRSGLPRRADSTTEENQ